MGIKIGAPALDLPAMLSFKDEAVDGNVKGVAFLLRKNKIDAHIGAGRILTPGQVDSDRQGWHEQHALRPRTS